MNPSTFYGHLNDAIQINTQRLGIYAGISRGKSLPLSLRLIFLERISLLAALYFDWRAAKFQKKGIRVIANDFVPMHPLPSPLTPPLYRQVADPKTTAHIKQILKTYRNNLLTSLDKKDFHQGATLSLTTLKNIRNLEETHRCHFAMTIHLIESVGLACVNAIGYAQQSNNATQNFSRNFIKAQAFGLRFCLALDKKAQPLHRLGIGILVNDMPKIPFHLKT